jgi:hypothetical protein
MIAGTQVLVESEKMIDGTKLLPYHARRMAVWPLASNSKFTPDQGAQINSASAAGWAKAGAQRNLQQFHTSGGVATAGGTAMASE